MAEQLVTRDEVDENGYICVNIMTKRGEMQTFINSKRTNIHVLVRNSSSQAWCWRLGHGKYFKTFDEARASYKSAECKAVIDYLEMRTKEVDAAKEAK